MKRKNKKNNFSTDDVVMSKVSLFMYIFYLKKDLK